jgi:iron complex outermembrane receptor protein
MLAEELTAYEVGYRVLPKPNLSFDVSTFFNDYNNLRSFERTSAITYPLANHLYGETYGVEISSDWGVTDNWHLVGGYSFLTMNLHNKPGSLDVTSQADEKASPANQYKLASHLNLPYNISFDNMLYYVASLDAYLIPSYTRFDTSLNWEAREGLEFSIVGQNLTDDRHREFTKGLYSVNNEIGRSIYGKVTVHF